MYQPNRGRYNIPAEHTVKPFGSNDDGLEWVQEGTVLLLKNGEELGQVHGPGTCIESSILVDEIPELRYGTNCRSTE